MSFFDLEAQKSGSTLPQDNNNTTDKALNLILEFTDELRKLERECSKVGTKRDSTAVRNHIETALIPHCNSLRDSVEEKLWSSEQLRNGSKVHNDFQVLKETLQKQEGQYHETKMKNPLKREISKVREEPSSNYVSIEVNEQTPLLLQEEQEQQQSQTQVQDSSLQNEIDFNSIIQRERSQQINRIHSAVQEVNAIFHQLGSLVNEQGEQVDTIDGNIGNFSNNMHKATDQLNRADEHQRKRNRCGLITLVIMIVVVLVVVLAVIS